MAEKPILFSTKMVRALLEGRKTQTRRLVKPVGKDEGFVVVETDTGELWPFRSYDGESWDDGNGCEVAIDCPYGSPGDTLWVRETWKIGCWREDGRLAIDYAASPEITKTPWVTIPEEVDPDGEMFNRYWQQTTDDVIKAGLRPDENGIYRWEPGKLPSRWRSSIHMPRWASRITLRVTGVRVERLQEITYEDACKEGIEEVTSIGPCRAMGWKDYSGGRGFFDPDRSFQSLWSTIHAADGPHGWAANPWVWVVEFEKESPHA